MISSSLTHKCTDLQRRKAALEGRTARSFLISSIVALSLSSRLLSARERMSRMTMEMHLAHDTGNAKAGSMCLQVFYAIHVVIYTFSTPLAFSMRKRTCHAPKFVCNAHSASLDTAERLFESASRRWRTRGDKPFPQQRGLCIRFVPHAQAGLRRRTHQPGHSRRHAPIGTTVRD